MYEYTKNWNKNIRELSGEFPSSTPNKSRVPRAKLYKKLLEESFKRQSFNKPLYRGITGKNRNYFSKSDVVRKPSMSSFSKNRSVARGYANNYRYNNYYVLVLDNPRNVPAINFGNLSRRNKEVVLPPGVFRVKNTKQNGRTKYIYVNFKSSS